MRKICFVTYDILQSYPDIDWLEAYVFLFEKAIKQGEKELARQVYYQIIAETIRTEDKWIIEEFSDPTNENYNTLIELNLLEFSERLKVIIPDESKLRRKRMLRRYAKDKWDLREDDEKLQFRYKSYLLCACCHKFVLTCEEIQNFPLEKNEPYVRATFEKALTQKELHKKLFLLQRLVIEYLDVDCDVKLFLELWVKAENAGAHFAPSGQRDIDIPALLKEENFKSLMTIVNYRHEEHDSLIDDIIAYLLEQGQFGLALYFNAKFSTPKERLYRAICEALVNDGDEEKEIAFIKMVNESVKHEKMEND